MENWLNKLKNRFWVKYEFIIALSAKDCSTLKEMEKLIIEIFGTKKNGAKKIIYGSHYFKFINN